jgi:hypothetical protein
LAFAATVRYRCQEPRRAGRRGSMEEMMRRRTFLTFGLTLTLALLGCDGDSGDGTGVLKGFVRDVNGKVVGGAVVQVGALSTTATFNGDYTLEKLPAGAATVKVTAEWFSELQQSATVKAGETTTLDLQLTAMPFKIDPADKALEEAYNKTYDWTKGQPSIAYAAGPTRRHLGNAIYYHNPAQYRDTAAEKDLTPSPQPDIDSTGAKNFTFPLQGGTYKGEETLAAGSIVASFDKTGLSSQADFLMVEPVLNWLLDWSPTKVVDLNAAVLAVRQQTWGSSSLRPQDIEMLWISPTKEVWVKIVFEGFVKLGSGVTDADGDGRKEIYAKLNTKLVTAEVVDKVQTDYVTTKLSTLEMRTELNSALHHLYTSTNLQIKKTIGQPYDLVGVGTIKYPFLIHEQTDLKGKKIQGALLIAP